MDRNEWIKAQYPGCRLSLSARRAWIEIEARPSVSQTVDVALRKESVDRNYAANAVDQILPGSLSARRAWIEMRITTFEVIGNMCRSPQGERG